MLPSFSALPPWSLKGAMPYSCVTYSGRDALSHAVLYASYMNSGVSLACWGRVMKASLVTKVSGRDTVIVFTANPAPRRGVKPKEESMKVSEPQRMAQCLDNIQYISATEYIYICVCVCIVEGKSETKTRQFT